MPVKVFSCMVEGIRGNLVEVEADILRGLPSFKIVGLVDAAVQESKERIRSAIKNSGAAYPQQKKVINLAPANLHKSGPQFDLPIGLSILAASAQVPQMHDSIFLGELMLSGKIKPVKGIISAAIFAKENGFKNLFIPKENAAEASFIDEIQIFPCDSLQQIIANLNGKIKIKKYIKEKNEIDFQRDGGSIDEIIGHEKAKRVLQIAAAGHHHILFSGPAGVGKTLLARALPTLLPLLSKPQAIEVLQIHSAKSTLRTISLERPFREVHHGATITALTGGGNPPTPGEISLAHEGTLFMDEFAEFPRSHIEALRKPLEEGLISIARNGKSIVFPANFILVAAMNPCPCGNLGDPQKECRCRPYQIINYAKKLSGPILDRIDLYTEVPRQNFSTIKNDSKKISNPIVRSIGSARRIQEERFKNKNISTNSQMSAADIKKFCKLKSEARELLMKASEHFKLSTRQFHKVLKVARTIADLSQKTAIEEGHIAEALQYRPDNHYNASV